jgi:trehalose/maltose hydrolase-like predicted phosphorylase
MLHAPYFQLYRRQVIKQADLVLAMHWCPQEFTAEQKARNVDYYERITVRDSSLSACTQAVMCAEVGHLELAYDYAWEAALVDLRDLHANTRDGLHMASLAGAWSAIVEGFGGLRERRRPCWRWRRGCPRHHRAAVPAAAQRVAAARRGRSRDGAGQPARRHRRAAADPAL